MDDDDDDDDVDLFCRLVKYKLNLNGVSRSSIWRHSSEAVRRRLSVRSLLT